MYIAHVNVLGRLMGTVHNFIKRTASLLHCAEVQVTENFANA